MNRTTRWGLQAGVLVLLAACSDCGPESQTAASSVTGLGDGSAGTGGDSGSNDSAPTGGAESDSTGGDDGSGGVSDAESSDGGEPEPEPLPPFDPMCDPGGGGGGVPGGNGAPCDAATPCEGGVCFEAGILGGVCGECSSDADCSGGGCTPPDFLADPPTPAMCNAGEQGEACESDDACCGIGLCRALLDIPGILAWRSCGECTSDADCPPGGTCQPDVSLSPIGGIWQCVLPSSLPLDHTCDPTNAAVAPCDGVCEPIDLEGLATIGVCGECSASADCTAGQTCQPGSADLETGALSGSRCV